MFQESCRLPLAQVRIAIAPGFGSRRVQGRRRSWAPCQKLSATCDWAAEVARPRCSRHDRSPCESCRSAASTLTPWRRHQAAAAECCEALSSANRRSQSFFPKTVTTMSKGRKPEPRYNVVLRLSRACSKKVVDGLLWSNSEARPLRPKRKVAAIVPWTAANLVHEGEYEGWKAVMHSASEVSIQRLLF
ncbi:hypothetical protein NGR_b07420 (plasmid) [Sinorhizobium fredii NGR234]|uniref:Uncharacterized protein n=1 Tax=Sinorhizobium fredii (strain NBRC 101917 / NGR234) TaxID=394 RepID=C3KQ42_SINFN|nr:hypothetical protein NGR_b07420 [Sinorhizobium fredii NGR234]